MIRSFPLEFAIFYFPQPAQALLCLFLCLLSAPLRAQLTPMQLPLDTRLNEQVVMVPAGPGGRDMLETTIFRPSGAGPFPLLLMNHGKQEGPARQQKRERFIYMATEFVRRGYAVMLPMRSGFALSTGAYRDYGCDMTANGYAQAQDVLDALAYARRQSWVDPDRIVVAGQSYGGLATMALAATSLPGVRGMFNFAGGLRVNLPACDWQSSLAKAYATFGAYSRIPSLWLYGANDSYFGPQLAQRWYQSYTGSGGKAELFAYADFKRDAHLTLGSRDGVAVWLPAVERFLASVNMPTQAVYSVIDPPLPPETRFAQAGDVSAVPYLADQGRAAYRAFLGKQLPRAFAVSETGAWGWAEEGESPDYRALMFCQQTSPKPCHLYLVDDSVVWPAGGNAGGHPGASSAAGGDD